MRGKMTGSCGIECQSADQDLVVSFSHIAHRNPYQIELIRGLEKLGIRIWKEGGIKSLIQSRIFGRTEWPEVYHIQWLPGIRPGMRGVIRAMQFFVSIYLRILMRQKIVWTVHDMRSHESPHPKIERLMGRTISKHAIGIIVHGESAISMVEDEFFIKDRKKIAVIPHGNYIGVYPDIVDRAEARRRIGVPDESIVYLFLGNIRPYKGVDDLIKAFRKLEDPNARLVIAGHPLNDELADEVKRLAAGDERIILHIRWVDDSEIEVFMKSCDVAVFPYQRVLTSGAVVLAMSFSRTCIVPSIGCFPDMIDDSVGFIYDDKSNRGLEGALRSALTRQSELTRLGELGYEKARGWSWNRVAELTCLVYRRGE